MASSTATCCPAFTESPTLTEISTITPGRGEVTGFPAPDAAGAAAGAGAGVGAGAGAGAGAAGAAAGALCTAGAAVWAGCTEIGAVPLPSSTL